MSELSISHLRVQPAKRERLADIVYGQLFEQISSGDFKEGQRLPTEGELARAFDASRPTVREALKRLQLDGLIVSRQGSGSYVKVRPPQRITEFAPASEIAAYLRTFEPRIVLESEAARLAALRRTRGQLADIEAAFDRLREAIEAGTGRYEDDLAFHMAIAEASGNTMFPKLLNAIGEAIRGTMQMALGLTRVGSVRRQQQVLVEHQQIKEAIAAQDSDGAAVYMRYHLTRARERVTDAQREL
ncbi:FadR/GntR family transcriptional regulator [Mesorhizobium sp.]|uniref:FadR/GntR family transcriptional regulator n=1 Tax=Mesorhizobium sp. TaxID=1871066 RepID=UPI000FE80F1C|nr:FadR/GntR family transcriptional regulator [Mesorhizobium sp.]RWI87939.1 MAG: FadR family transcriptional regulator [Mesorhizobium sp.]